MNRLFRSTGVRPAASTTSTGMVVVKPTRAPGGGGLMRVMVWLGTADRDAYPVPVLPYFRSPSNLLDNNIISETGKIEREEKFEIMEKTQKGPV